MKKAINRPQLFFIFLSIITLVSGYINQGADIQIALYGAFLNFSAWSICLFSTIFFVLIAVNYASLTITQRQPKKVLTVIHIILQVASIIPLLYFVYNANITRTYQEVSQMNIVLILTFILFIVATIIHLINFIASLLSKKD